MQLETNLFNYSTDGNLPNKNTPEEDFFWHEKEDIPPLHCELGMIKCRTDIYKPEGKLDENGQAIDDFKRYSNIKLEQINESLLKFTSNSNNPQMKSSFLGEKTDRTKIKRQAFICFGSYNIILIRPNVSAKALTSANYNNGAPDEWPPRFNFPYFVNTHPLIRLDFNKKHNREKVKKHGVFFLHDPMQNTYQRISPNCSCRNQENYK